jgi:hypothetical protein
MKLSLRCTGDGSPVVAARYGASFQRHKISLKKSLRPAEQERADVAQARRRWMREQGMFDPARLVFLNETLPLPTWTAINRPFAARAERTRTIPRLSRRIGVCGRIQLGQMRESRHWNFKHAFEVAGTRAVILNCTAPNVRLPFHGRYNPSRSACDCLVTSALCGPAACSSRRVLMNSARSIRSSASI